jgi:hypothetical protein
MENEARMHATARLRGRKILALKAEVRNRI